jgi:hypothetical protein
MKRALIATILGLAASVASSYGQASYVFDTYFGIAAVGAAPSAGVVQWTTTASLAPAGQAGVPVLDAAGFKGDLLWSVASGPGAGSGDLGLAIPVTGGYIQQQTIVNFDPTYTVAGIPITFTIEAFNGASYATSTAYGSLVWTDAAGEVPGTGAKAFALTLPIVVSQAAAVPEPTTLALAGLGAAGLLMFRKRQ